MPNAELELAPDAIAPLMALYSKVSQVRPETATEQGGRVTASLSCSPLNTGIRPENYESQTDKLHKAWAGFLSTQDWQWFVTFTFKEEIHPEAADKLYRVWLNKLNRELYGQRWRKKPSGGVKWCRALEWQKRGVLHYHALISNSGYASSTMIARIWEKLGEDSKAGFIKVDQYDESLGGAEAYLSKYVAKGGQVDISPNFQANNQIPDHEQRRTREFRELDRG